MLKQKRRTCSHRHIALSKRFIISKRKFFKFGCHRSCTMSCSDESCWVRASASFPQWSVRLPVKLHQTWHSLSICAARMDRDAHESHNEGRRHQGLLGYLSQPRQKHCGSCWQHLHVGLFPGENTAITSCLSPLVLFYCHELNCLCCTLFFPHLASPGFRSRYLHVFSHQIHERYVVYVPLPPPHLKGWHFIKV